MLRQYAIVCYLEGEIAAFARRVRLQLNPTLAHLAPHVTVLPPRAFESEISRAAETAAAESQAAALLQAVAGELAPIRISLGQVKTFLPAHPTVYIEIEDGARHLRYANGALKRVPFVVADTWPYVPHLTLATLADEAATRAACTRANEEWAAYPGARGAVLDELSLVREESPDRWSDVVAISLIR